MKFGIIAFVPPENLVLATALAVVKNEQNELSHEPIDLLGFIVEGDTEDKLVDQISDFVRCQMRNTLIEQAKCESMSKIGNE